MPGVHIQNDGIMQCTAAEHFLRSDRLRYGQWHRRMWPEACSYSQPHPIVREKASSVVSQSIRPNSLVGVGHVNKIVMHKLQTTVDAWVSYDGSKQHMAWQEVWLYNAQVMFLLLIGWIECRLAGGWIPVKKMSHMTDKRATTYWSAIKSCITLIVSCTASALWPLAKD